MKFSGFVGPSYVSMSERVSVDETINLYLERNPITGEIAFFRAPGLTEEYTTTGDVKCRAMMELNGHVWAVIGSYVYHFIGSLTLDAKYGPIANDGKRAQFAVDPNLVQLVVYSGGKAYVLQSGTIAEITWPAVSLAGVALLNQYFLFLSGDGDGFFYSEPGDATTGDPLNFRSAEASGNQFISILIDHEQVWLLGTQITQVFYNDTNDADEPFKPNPSAVIPRGTCSAENPISFNNRVWWIDQSGIARRSNGYLPERVSTHAVENAWRKYGTISDAVSWWAIWNGHMMLRFWFPQGNETWQLDTDSLDWTKVLGWNAMTGSYTAHRGMSSCEAFGMMLVGDRENGKIYSMSPDVFFDDGQRVPWLRRCPIINDEGKMIDFPWFELDCETGVGDGSNADPLLGTVTPEADPTVMMRWSNDWGKSYANIIERSLGKLGEYNKRVYWARCGMGRNRVFEISGTAGVRIAIKAAYLDQPQALSA